MPPARATGRDPAARARRAGARWPRLVIALATALLGTVILAPPGAPSATLADAVVAEIDGRIVTLSDIALARALGLFGLAPATGPVDRTAVERFADVSLVLEEARRLHLQAPDPDVEHRWAEIAEPFGGPEGLEAWLAQARVNRYWARRLVQLDDVYRQFVDIRFRAFVFVTEAEIDRAVGAGASDEGARERARQEIVNAEVARHLAEWTATARRGARIRVLAPVAGATLPDPLPGPTWARPPR